MNALTHSKGLMFTLPSFVCKHSLVFIFSKPAVRSFHMFFVFYPIDVLFLDEHFCVIDLKESFAPFTSYSSSLPSKYVLEFAAGTIARTNTRRGDKIFWEKIDASDVL